MNRQVLQAEQSKVAGIQIWSIAGDDTEGVCGKGSYPILRYIRNYELQRKDPKPFGKFADLDIALSTGESEEVEFLQDLDAKQELKKLPCERVGFYRHPSDCTRFYHCSEHRITKFNHSGPYAGFLYRCPNGLVYDEKQSSCIWPSMSDPCKGSGELLPVPNQKFACVTAGFHADPENCRWFYYCSDLGDGQLEAFEFLCPSDLLGFDEKKLLCNWKWTVPACLNYSKRPESSTESVYISTNSEQNRKGKELNLQGIPLLRTTTKQPHRLRLSSRENESKNETFLSAVNTSVSIPGENWAFLTTDDKPNEMPIEVQNVSTEGEKFTSQQNLPEKKYGTAVWRRSWLSYVTDQRNRVNNPPEDQKFKDSNNYTQINTENRDTNQNDSGIPNGFEPLPKEDEGKRMFKGRVRKISLKSNQSAEHGRERSRNKIGTMVQEQIPKIRANTNDEENNIVFSSPNKEVKKDEMSLPEVQSKSPPYVNVRCSKLENEKGEDKDTNTFGCTSEVSLTIHIPRGKNISRYILKEDRISKTAYQESQKISHLQNIDDMGRTANDINLKHKTSSIPLLIPPRNEVPLMQKFDTTSDHKKFGEMKVATEPSRASKFTNDLDFELQASFLTKSPENYEVKQPHNIGEAVSEHFKLKAEKLRDEGRTNIDKPQQDEPPRAHRNSAKSMPVHFYPQGVLLNIDLTHVSEIPPQILLEVDNMLRKYMHEGDIDVTLLERKLNVTAVSAEENAKNKDPKEIMEVIKAIENMLNASKERELNHQANGEALGKTDLLYTKEMQQDNAAVPTEGNSSEYEKIAVPTKNISLELEIVTPPENISYNNDSLNHTEMRQSDNKQRNPLISDKIQDSELPDSIPINISDRKAFGRRRLFRKFRYPSIREQLQKQTQLQNLQREGNAFEISDLDIKRQSSLTYTYPLSRNRAVSTHPNVSVAIDDTYLKQSENISLPEPAYNVVRTSALPYGFELKIVGDRSDLSNNQNEDIHSRSLLPHYDSTHKWAILETAYASRSSGSSYSETSSDVYDPRLQTDIETVVTLQREGYVNSSANQASLDETGRHDKKNPIFRYGDRATSTFKDWRNNGRGIAAYSPDFVELSRSREEDAYVTRNLRENAANLDRIDNYNVRESAKNPENYEINNYDEHSETRNSFPSNSQDYTAERNHRRNGLRGSISTRSEEQKLDNIRLAAIHEGRKRQNFTQTRGKRKLRVLVRKVVDNRSNPRQEVAPTSDFNDEKDVQEKIPKSNILRALKDRILQRHSKDSIHDVELQIRYIDHVWNIPFVNEKSKAALSPAVCTRAGLFQHPTDCNTFYECFWDKWLQKFTLHVFSCPVKLVYDTNVRGCGRPSADSPCANHAK